MCIRDRLPNDEGQIVDVPRHISILPGSMPGRGGYLGDQFDAFKVFDPLRPIPDVRATVGDARQQSRIEKLKFVDEQFLNRRRNNRAISQTLKNSNLEAALSMMSSDQLEAFDVSKVSQAERAQFGDTPFGRGCAWPRSA